MGIRGLGGTRGLHSTGSIAICKVRIQRLFSSVCMIFVVDLTAMYYLVGFIFSLVLCVDQ